MWKMIHQNPTTNKNNKNPTKIHCSHCKLDGFWSLNPWNPKCNDQKFSIAKIMVIEKVLVTEIGLTKNILIVMQ